MKKNKDVALLRRFTIEKKGEMGEDTRSDDEIQFIVVFFLVYPAPENHSEESQREPHEGGQMWHIGIPNEFSHGKYEEDFHETQKAPLDPEF